MNRLKSELLWLNSFLLGILCILSSISFGVMHDPFPSRVLGVTVPQFDRNMIVTDTAFRTLRALPTSDSIQTFLQQVNSPLQNYTENSKSASEIIFEAAQGITSEKWGIKPNINPGVLLAYLEKEQSLLTLSGYDTLEDKEKRIRYAMGYGCPDGSPCSVTYAGFTNQLNWAAYQLEYNMSIAQKQEHNDPYRVNKTITTLDGYNVFLSNAATAAQYRYTPHVYWGNYNLWKLIIAYGWGDSAETFDRGAIDRANLGDRTIGENGPVPTTVDRSEIEALLQNEPAVGTSNHMISKLQVFLKNAGFFTYPTITGYYGLVTQNAYRAYKSSPQYQILPITTQTAANACETLFTKNWSIGQTGADVTSLQRCLQERGLFSYPGGPTGYFGPVTQAALQKQRLSSHAQTAQKTCTELKSQNWTLGTSGSEVARLQQCLKDEGLYTWPAGITGYFGNYTQSLLAQSSAHNSSSVTKPPQTTLSRCNELKSRTWTIGTVGNEVRELQQCLKDEGLYTWPSGITGYFGNYTQSLLRPIGGGCDSFKNQARTWSIGRVGDDVRQLQQCLKDSGVYTWPAGVTGYFGNYTKSLL